MDQYETLVCGLLIFFFSAFLVFLTKRHSTSRETFDEFLKEREEKLEIPVNAKKDRKRKLKKGKVIGVAKKKAEKRDTRESASGDTEVNGDINESQNSRPSSVRPDDVAQSLQNSERRLDSGRLHQRKGKVKNESQFVHTNDDSDIQVHFVKKVSEPSVERKVAPGKFVNRSERSDKRGRMEELDEIYPIEVGNWSYATDTATSGQSSDHSLVSDGRKKSFRGEEEKEENPRSIKCCQELKSNFDTLLKQNLDQKSEIEMLRSTVHMYSVQRLNEIQALREYHDEEMKKVVDENRELKVENRIKQEATAIKNRQLDAMNLTIDDLKKKIDIMGSALETNARMYNSSENGRKNAESRLKQFEARFKEMESAARQEIGAVQRFNDLGQKLQAKAEALHHAMGEVEMLKKEIALNADAYQSALTEVETLRKENAVLNVSRRQCEELKRSIALLKSDKEALHDMNDANELRISQSESSLVECKRMFERQLRDVEETLQKKESEMSRLAEDKETLLFRLSKLESASSELEASEEQKKQLEERLRESELKIEQLKETERQLIESSVTAPPKSLPDSTGNQREVTVFTHVNEKAKWDMSQLVLDLDTKEAEINILHSLLTQRETKLKESERENAGLSSTIKRLQSDMKLNEGTKVDEIFRNTNGLTDSLKIVNQKELHQELLLQLHSAQSEVKKLEKELKVLRGSTENLTDIDFAYRCVEKSLTNIVDEMEEKIKDLQDRLDVAEAEKLETFLQLSQLRATHELVLEELHDLRQADCYKEDLVTEDDDGSLSQTTRQ